MSKHKLLVPALTLAGTALAAGSAALAYHYGVKKGTVATSSTKTKTPKTERRKHSQAKQELHRVETAEDITAPAPIVAPMHSFLSVAGICVMALAVLAALVMSTMHDNDHMALEQLRLLVPIVAIATMMIAVGVGSTMFSKRSTAPQPRVMYSSVLKEPIENVDEPSIPKQKTGMTKKKSASRCPLGF